MDYDPLDDGLTHINFYSRGMTELGRLGTNFAHTPFVHPEHGRFESMEGYWYWIKSGKWIEALRRVYGYSAKLKGTKFPNLYTDRFEQDIREGIECKLAQTPRLQELLIASDLPLVHYYLRNGQAFYPRNVSWQMKIWEDLREQYQNAPPM